jgi:hypothetical protein
MKRGLIVGLYVMLAMLVGSAKAEVVDSEILLQPPDPHLNKAFGYSVAINGTNAVVGATEDAMQIGAAYVYSKFGSNWVFQQRLVPAQAGTNDLVGASVAISGNLIAIGAPGFNTNSSTALPGAVFTFGQTNGVWSQQAWLFEPDGQRGDRFGTSVAITGSGQTIVVGSSFHSDFGATNSGAVYVYDFTGIGWQLAAKIVPNDLTNNSFFGQRVAMSGDTLVIGANSSLIGNTNFPFITPGAVYIYIREETNQFFRPFVLQQKLLPPDLRNGGNFGFSVAISGDTALVGAPGATNGGTVFAFVRNNSLVWTQQTQLIASNTVPGDNFGFSVGFQGVRAVIGAPGAASNDLAGVGAAYVFTQTNVPSSASLFTATNPVTTNPFAPAVAIAPTNVIADTNQFASANTSAQSNAVADTNVFTPPTVVAPTNVIASSNFFTSANVTAQSNSLANTNIFAPSSAPARTTVLTGTNAATPATVVAQSNAVANTNAVAFPTANVVTNVIAQPTNVGTASAFVGSTNVFSASNILAGTGLVQTTVNGQTNIVITQANETAQANDGWVEQQELRPLQQSANFQFGFSIGIGTSGIIVGTPSAQINRGNGAAFVFESSESIVSITSLRATPPILLTQNRLFVPVTVTVETTGPNVTSRIISVTSNQADVGRGANADAPDSIITGDLTVLLRAEGNDNVDFDRVYNIVVEATDQFGNFAIAAVPVIVPHSLGGTPSVTSAAVFDVPPAPFAP